MESEDLVISRTVIIDGGSNQYGFTGNKSNAIGQIVISATTGKVEISNVKFDNDGTGVKTMLDASNLQCDFTLTNSVFNSSNDLPVVNGNAEGSTVTVVLEKNTIKANVTGRRALDIKDNASALTMRLIENDFSGQADEYYILISGTPALTAKGNIFSTSYDPVKYTDNISISDQIADQLKSTTEVNVNFSGQ